MTNNDQTHEAAGFRIVLADRLERLIEAGEMVEAQLERRFGSYVGEERQRENPLQRGDLDGGL